MSWICKTVLGMFICLLFCMCAGQEDLLPDGIIRLGIGTEIRGKTSTRVSVNDLAGLVAVGNNIGVYGVVTECADALHEMLVTEWNGTPLMNNVRTSGIDARTGMLFWDGNYTYPLEENRLVKFCVYHPYASIGTDTGNCMEVVAGKSPVLHFRLTGTEDVMWVHPVIGSRRYNPSVLLFEHKLTQLRFRLIDDEGEFTGVNITELVFNEVNTNSTLNLETGELGEWLASPDAVSFPLKSPVGISGTTDMPQILAGEVMLQPGQPVFRLTLKTDSRGDYPDIEIRPSGGETFFSAGLSYMVTLKFQNRTAMAFSAKVTPWVMDGYGEGMVE